MRNESRQLIRDAIVNSMGDDLERATHAFANRTTKQMEEQWGASGMTCQQILDEYQHDRNRRKLALSEFDAAHPA